MHTLKHELVLKALLCCLVVLVSGFDCFAQNNNSSSPHRRKKITKPAKEPILPDLTGIEDIVRDINEWPEAGTTSYSSVHYGAKTIKRFNGNIVRVWTKITPKDETDKTKSEFLRVRRAQGLSTAGYENYSHTFELAEYNCTKGEGRVLSHLDYDINGNVIDSVTFRRPEWDYVVPHSIGELLLQAVCKKRK